LHCSYFTFAVVLSLIKSELLVSDKVRIINKKSKFLFFTVASLAFASLVYTQIRATVDLQINFCLCCFCLFLLLHLYVVTCLAFAYALAYEREHPFAFHFVLIFSPIRIQTNAKGANGEQRLLF
jgi:hypothetical protein